MALATLSVDLVARLAQFQQGMDQAGQIAEARAGRIRAAFDGLKDTGLAIGGALTAAFAAGGAVAAFVQRLNAPLLAMKDLTEATGAAFENVSALEDIARRAGVQFDVVGGALVRFNQSLNAADSATAPISIALQRIGLDAAELRRQDPALALRQVAQALAGFADDGEKARLVQELFGKSVRETGPFLRDLAEATEFAGRVTAQQAEEADKLDKAIAQLKTNAEDAARVVLSSLVPALNALADAVRNRGMIGGLIELNEQLGRTLGTDPGSILARRINETRTELDALRAGFASLADGPRANAALTEIARLEERLRRLQGVQDAARRRMGGDLTGLPLAEFSNEGRPRRVGAAPPIAQPAGRRPAAEAPRLSLTPEQATLIEALRRLEQTDEAKLQGLRGQLEALVRLVQGGGVVSDSVFAGLADELARLDPAAVAAQERINRINAALAETPAFQLQAAATLARELYDELGTATDPARIEQINQALDKLRERLGLVTPEAEKTTRSMTTFAEQAARNIQDALGDTLEQVLGGNFANIGRLWAQTLQRMAAQAAAARLNELIFSSLGSSSNPLLAAIGNIFKPRADGGPVEGGNSYLVGERGPELITMGAGRGWVTNTERLRRAMGGSGGGMTYAPTIVVQGDVGPATVRLVEQAMARERARAARMQYAQGAG
jgi:hypothetical protein